ncbi:unnamed protein product, partial [Closterium sp. NIES-54]
PVMEEDGGVGEGATGTVRVRRAGGEGWVSGREGRGGGKEGGGGNLEGEGAGNPKGVQTGARTIGNTGEKRSEGRHPVMEEDGGVGEGATGTVRVRRAGGEGWVSGREGRGGGEGGGGRQLGRAAAGKSEEGGGAVAAGGRVAAGDAGAAAGAERGEAAAHTAVTPAADSQAAAAGAAAGEGRGPGGRGWRREVHKGERNGPQGEWGEG